MVAVAALALAGAPYRLVSPQLVAALAALVAYAGALGATGPDAVVDVVAVLVLAGAAWAGLRTGRAVLAYAVGTAAVLPWMHLASDALARALEDPTLREVWAGPGPALVAASLLVLLPVAGHREPTAVAALGGVAATLLTITVALPAVDEGGTAATGAALAATLAWTAAAWLLRARDAWRLLPLIPALASAVPVVGVVLALSVQAVTAVGSSGPVFARDADVRIGSVDPVAAPWLLLAGVAALVGLAWVSARPPAAWWPAAVTTIGLGAAATLALLPVPLAVPLVVLVGVAGLLLATGARPAAIAVLLLVTVGALPSALLTGLAALTVAGVGAWCLRPGESATSRLLGGAVTPPAAALAGVGARRRGGAGRGTARLPGAAHRRPARAGAPPARGRGDRMDRSADRRPRGDQRGRRPGHGDRRPPDRGRRAGRRQLAGQPAAPGARLGRWAVAGRGDLGPARRPRRRGAGGLHAAVGPGAARGRPRPAAARPGGGDVERAHPGLLLATVPSLLWCLDDPVTWRAAWLGVACVGLVLAGTLARWHAPLMVGGTVGGVLVVRELAPYAAETPQWILIGAAGALLTLVGVTWEHRLAEVRQAAAYLDRLR